MLFLIQTLRWDFSGNKAEYIKQLKSQMEGSFSKEFIDILFHATDFKVHVKGIEILQKVYFILYLKYFYILSFVS